VRERERERERKIQLDWNCCYRCGPFKLPPFFCVICLDLNQAKLRKPIADSDRNLLSLLSEPHPRLFQEK
jgi:hypothetical protein